MEERRGEGMGGEEMEDRIRQERRGDGRRGEEERVVWGRG